MDASEHILALVEEDLVGIAIALTSLHGPAAAKTAEAEIGRTLSSRKFLPHYSSATIEGALLFTFGHPLCAFERGVVSSRAQYSRYLFCTAILAYGKTVATFHRDDVRPGLYLPVLTHCAAELGHSHVLAGIGLLRWIAEEQFPRATAADIGHLRGAQSLSELSLLTWCAKRVAGSAVRLGLVTPREWLVSQGVVDPGAEDEQVVVDALLSDAASRSPWDLAKTLERVLTELALD